MDIAEFVRARLDEDEAAAKAAAGKRKPPWRSEALATDLAGRVNNSPEGASPSARDRGVVADTNSRSIADHVARHDPARVLRKVTLGRTILAQHGHSPHWQPGDDLLDCQYQKWPCPTLRALAAVYSDHPDYDPAWAVTREGS